MDKSDWKNSVSLYLKLALEFLFIDNKKGTSYGFMLGWAVFACQSLLIEISPIFTKIDPFFYPIAGVLLFNFVNVVLKPKTEKERQTDADLRQLKKIHTEAAKAGAKISPAQIRQNYQAYVRNFVAECAAGLTKTEKEAEKTPETPA